MPCRYHVDDEWCEPVRVTPGQRLGRSVAVVGSEATFGRVVLLALILQRRDNRGNPDLAVAAVEVGILAPALLRYLRCVHDCSPISPSVASTLNLVND